MDTVTDMATVGQDRVHRQYDPALDRASGVEEVSVKRMSL